MVTHITMLETQISQVSQQQAYTRAPSRIILGKPQPNPKWHVNDITLWSGKELEVVSNKRDEGNDTESESIPFWKERNPTPPTKEVVEEESYVSPPPYKPQISFPQILVKTKIEYHFRKFVEVFKKFYINIPFIKELSQIPSYAKFLKEILSSKWKLKDIDILVLTQECNFVIQKKMPPKLKDHESFFVPCIIRSMRFEKPHVILGWVWVWCICLSMKN